jgi:hypothetical protein
LLVAFTIVWAAWAGWSLIGRATPYELRVLDDLGEPIAEAVVDIAGDQAGTSSEDGRIPSEWSPSRTILEVSAPGHVAQTLTLAERPEGVVDVVLNARIMRGRVVDADGVAVSDALVSTDAASTITDGEGHFHVRGAEPGRVSVERPAWLATEFTWDGGAGETLVEMVPFAARAVHISGEAARDRFDEFLEMAKSTELNALMLDLKDEFGLVWYQTSDPTAIEVGANHNAYNLESAVSRAHDEGLYVIGRIVLFNDPVAARGKPEMAVWDADANAPYNANGQYFLDPTDPDARQYGIDIAVEACSMGVDEIQFDYVRFPDARTEASTFDLGVSQEVRMSVISTFLHDAVAALRPMGCAVAADVFGFITRDPADGGIGQRWEDIAMIVDVVSPMVYPSHYTAGWYGFDNPNDHPGEMVGNALSDGMDRLPRSVVVRPWLQDFGYDAGQVRAQIASAEDFGLGWMLWNATSTVTTEALLPAE